MKFEKGWETTNRAPFLSKFKSFTQISVPHPSESHMDSHFPGKGRRNLPWENAYLLFLCPFLLSKRGDFEGKHFRQEKEERQSSVGKYTLLPNPGLSGSSLLRLQRFSFNPRSRFEVAKSARSGTQVMGGTFRLVSTRSRPQVLRPRCH